MKNIDSIVCMYMHSIHLWVSQLSLPFVPCLAMRNNGEEGMVLKNSSHQANMQITPTTICYGPGKLPWRHWEKLLNHLVCHTWRLTCSWKNKKIQSTKTQNIQYIDTFINGTDKLTTLAACESVQDWTHLWPASCCIDGMAKKLFRDCEAADDKRRQKHRF